MKGPSNVVSVKNVSSEDRHCVITKENSNLVHRTNVNHVVKISLMTMLWRDMIARNDLLETKKDSLAGCVMNTATILVDIFITCINICKDNPKIINDSALPRAMRGVLCKITYERWYKRCGFASYSSVSVHPCSFAHICRFACSLVSIYSIEHVFLRPWFSQHRYAVYNG